MRTRPLVLVALLAAVGPLGLAGAVTPAVAAPAGTITTDGWTWEVLTGENDLFGDVTPPDVTGLAGLDVDTTAPTLRAPSIPVLYSFIQNARWTYGGVVIDQPVADGPATVTADLSGPGGVIDVTAEVDGGSVEYTLTWAGNLSNLVGVFLDPFADGYTDGELRSVTDGQVQTEIGGWMRGSASHHSGAWALDQLDSDPDNAWVLFVEAADAPVDVMQPAAAPAASPLTRAFIFADGPNTLSTGADTWFVRIALAGGAGCAATSAELEALATTLTTGATAGTSADDSGCLAVEPVTGTLGEPLDVLLPLDLDPALASTTWWNDRPSLGLRTGALPAGLTAELEVVADEPYLRIQGTPESAGAATVALALGGESNANGTDLIDAVGGELTVTIAPALAATGATEGVPLTLGLGAGLLLALGALLVGTRAHRRRLG